MKLSKPNGSPYPNQRNCKYKPSHNLTRQFASKTRTLIIGNLINECSVSNKAKGITTIAGKAGPANARNPLKVMDARVKIIRNNRAKIRDARDKLVELTRSRIGDIRQDRLNKIQRPHLPPTRNAFNNIQLTQMSKRLPPTNYMGRGDMPIMYYDNPMKEVIHLPPSRRQRAAQPPLGYVDYDNMEQMESGWYS